MRSPLMTNPRLTAAPGSLLWWATQLQRWLYRLAVGGGLCLTVFIAAAQGFVVAITRPQAGETVHDNTGAVPVAVTVQGGALAADQRVVVLLDGKPYGAERRTLAFVLQDVDRGEHSLQVQLVDAKGAVVGTSSALTFYLWRASSQFPLRKREPPAPK